MGFLSSIGNAFKKVGKSVGSIGHKVVQAVKPALPVISGLVGSVASAIPVIGPFVGTASNIVSGLISSSSSSGSVNEERLVPAAVEIAGSAPAPAPATVSNVIASIPKIVEVSAAAASPWKTMYNALTDKI